MKRFIITQSDKEFYTSHSGLALVGLCVNELCSLPAKAREAFPVSAGSTGIGLDDLLRSYLGLLATGQSDYEAITNRREDSYFRESLGIGKVPSSETLRQRLDELAPALRHLSDACSVEFLKKAEVAITPLATGHVPLDCDVFAMVDWPMMCTRCSNLICIREVNGSRHIGTVNPAFDRPICLKLSQLR